MPRFGKTSQSRLSTCHNDLQRLFNRVVEKYDCTIICGQRSHEEQTSPFSNVSHRHKTRAGREDDDGLPGRVLFKDIEEGMKNDEEVSKVFRTTKAIKKITLDPDLETADIDTSNNSWPKRGSNRFEMFKNNVKM